MSSETYLSLLPPWFRLRPRFAALASALLKQSVDLFTLLESLPAAYALSTAEGTQLDTLGTLVNIPRPATTTTDSDYRELLRARIAAHTWNGCNDTLPSVLSLAFPARTATLNDTQNGRVTATLSGTAPAFPLSALFPYPAGISLGS